MKTPSMRIALLLMTALMLAASLMPWASADPAAVPDVETTIVEIDKNGNVTLAIDPESMAALGYEVADVISVKIGDAGMELPIGTNYADVDYGKPICCFRTNSKGGREVLLSINLGDLATTMGIAERRSSDGKPGYEWVLAEGLEEPVPVLVSMVRKQGYADEYALHQVFGTRSNRREDYESLSDAEYANFRAIRTRGIGRGALYRSSSPVNPIINRNREADEALARASIRTVMNMADTVESMGEFEGFSRTHYAQCNVIALDMDLDFTQESYGDRLAEGFRFIATHDGPYLIHCVEGKDRTGFACAILECLMGASVGEIVSDYMLTYANYYGIAPEDDRYGYIAATNILASLATAFDIPSIRDVDVDLAACAEGYLVRIGMGAEEIRVLKEKLGKDYE